MSYNDPNPATNDAIMLFKDQESSSSCGGSRGFIEPIKLSSLGGEEPFL